MAEPIWYPEINIGMRRFIDGYIAQEGRWHCVYVHFDTPYGPNRGHTKVAFSPTREAAEQYLDACKTVEGRLKRSDR